MTELDDDEPPRKRPRLRPSLKPSDIDFGCKFCSRLNELMLCNVCHEVPLPDDLVQCSAGHVLCEDCTTYIISDSKIQKKTARCPVCRTDLEWRLLLRNPLLRETVSECLKCCHLCFEMQVIKNYERHLKEECVLRQVNCRYRCLGCEWNGAAETAAEHEEHCKFVKMNRQELLDSLELEDAIEREENMTPILFLQMLSSMQVFQGNVQVYWDPEAVAGDYVTSRKLESQPFVCYDERWLLRMTVSHYNTPTLRYCLHLLSTPKEPKTVYYMIMVSDKRVSNIKPEIHARTYVAEDNEGVFHNAKLSDPRAVHRIMSMDEIIFRIWIFTN
ncbi:hypothetical protein KR018_007245 [Drosophila ironensis]|nr:hypothetical protein KR018_007245 [Drosophila ironensis]